MPHDLTGPAALVPALRVPSDAVPKSAERTFTLDVSAPTVIALVRDSPGLEALWLGQLQAGGRTRVGRGSFGERRFEVVCDLEPDQASQPFAKNTGLRGFPFTRTPMPGLFSSAASISGELVDDPHGSRLVLHSPRTALSRGQSAGAALLGMLGVMSLSFAGQWLAAGIVACALAIAGVALRDRWRNAADGQRLLEGLVLGALSAHVVEKADSPFRRRGTRALATGTDDR